MPSPSVGDIERLTQNRVVKELFCKNQLLGYSYIGNLEDELNNSNVRVDTLKKYLSSAGYSEYLVNKAVEKVVEESKERNRDFYDANKEFYRLLRYGVNVKDENSVPRTIYLINWNQSEIENNIFEVAEEVTIIGAHEKRPDVVVYVNGISLAVIEFKRSSVSVADGIRQNLTNQRDDFIREFFVTSQILLAGNDTEGLRYGTTRTPEKYYLEWKNYEGSEKEQPFYSLTNKINDVCRTIENKLDKQIYSLFEKHRFLQIIYNFIIFDKGIKKICRHNQYFGITEAVYRINNNKGGIIWHTQGSGKSLTMVWLSKWYLENFANGRVLIVTDREELDDQIEKLYIGVEENISRTKSGKELISYVRKDSSNISNPNPNFRLVCSLIQKCGRHNGEVTDTDYDRFIKDLELNGNDFSNYGDFLVFVDECHRTQSGKLHAAMKKMLPNAIFIGFTGTPLLKKDKQTSMEVFGKIIHSYKFDEGVRDGAIVDLLYDPRNIEQEITNQARIDQWFDVKTAGLSEKAKAQLKRKWANMQKFVSARSRLEKIAEDIIMDMNIKPRLVSGTGNAMLVAEDIYSACKYYEIFKAKGFRQCAVITSYDPSTNGKITTETTSLEEDTEGIEKYNIYKSMIGDMTVEQYEEEMKKQFVNEPARMKLLIVVDKLLTGFDAPHATYLYIDKSMQDHGLFQAICRVNRLDDGKEFGYIVDYKELFTSLTDAINAYTKDAFAGFDEKDIEGLLKNYKLELKKKLEALEKKLDDLCSGVDEPKGLNEYCSYFGCDDEDFDNEELAKVREKLYTWSASLFNTYTDCKADLSEFGYDSERQKTIDDKVQFYLKLKNDIAMASGDFIDLKKYEHDMRYLIDTYIDAKDSEKIAEIDDFSLLKYIISQRKDIEENPGKKTINPGTASTIENNVRKKIIEKRTTNPIYYEKMSILLDKLVEARKNATLTYKELLDKYEELVKNVETPENNEEYPKNIRSSSALRAFYDLYNKNEAKAIQIYRTVKASKQADFRTSDIKKRKIERALSQNLGLSKEEIKSIMKLVVEQEEF